jgi:hypothetical protein
MILIDNIIKLKNSKHNKFASNRNPNQNKASNFKKLENRPRKFAIRQQQQPLSNKPFGLMNKSKAIQINRSQHTGNIAKTAFQRRAGINPTKGRQQQQNQRTNLGSRQFNRFLDR